MIKLYLTDYFMVFGIYLYTTIVHILIFTYCILILYILYLYILLESSPTGETINSLSAWKGIHILGFIPFSYPVFPVSHQCFCCIILKGSLSMYIYLYTTEILYLLAAFISNRCTI